MPNASVDRLIRAGAVYSMAGPVHRVLAVRGSHVVAVSPEPDGLDHLIGDRTEVTDCPDLTVLPAFADAHEHLLEAARNTGLVSVAGARSVAELTGAIARAAGTAAAGEWILTSVAWHESNLAEKRMPTRAELDAVSSDHPVFARRGGHLAVANSAALRRAGITAATPDPQVAVLGATPTANPTACWKARRCTRSRLSPR